MATTKNFFSTGEILVAFNALEIIKMASSFLCPAMHLIIRAAGFWRVSKEVGMKGGGMRTRVAFKADQMQPPVKGWEFSDDGGKYQSDPLMECSREVTPVCDEVRVEGWKCE